jgi:hypothetical protein
MSGYESPAPETEGVGETVDDELTPSQTTTYAAGSTEDDAAAAEAELTPAEVHESDPGM